MLLGVKHWTDILVIALISEFLDKRSMKLYTNLITFQQ